MMSHNFILTILSGIFSVLLKIVYIKKFYLNYLNFVLFLFALYIIIIILILILILLTLGAHAQRGYSSCLVCVCLYVRTHAILAVRAIRRITKDAIVFSVRSRFAAILKWRFP